MRTFKALRGVVLGASVAMTMVLVSAASAAPSVVSESASQITTSDATLEASIATQPEERALTQFQLARSPGELSPEFQCPKQWVGFSLCLPLKGETPFPIQAVEPPGGGIVSLNLAGVVTLSPSTTYYYRILAAKKGPVIDEFQVEPPVVYGPTQSFTTLGPPTVTRVQPINGPSSGGTTVTVTGTGFSGATAVKFGENNAASFTVTSSTSITATAPAGIGTVDVTVSTPSGTSATSEADRFTYIESPPVIESESATNVTPTDATLNATINTHGLETGYWFQIYTNDTYNFTRPACPFRFEECSLIIVGEPLPQGLVEPEPAYIEAGSGTKSVSIDLARVGATLQPGTTYDFRVLAASPGAPRVTGANATFTTPGPQPIHAEFNNWSVTGSLAAGGQTINLPKGATFNGIGEIKVAEGGLITGKIDGAVNIPPFTAEIEFPKKSGEHQVAGLALTEVGSVSGTATSTSPANCPNPVAGTPETCVNLKIPTTQDETFTVVGPGNGLPSKTVSHCQTVEPIKLELSTNLTILELTTVGSHFVGTYTVPPITCSGKYGKGRGEQLTEELSGPASYEINVNPPTM